MSTPPEYDSLRNSLQASNYKPYTPSHRGAFTRDPTENLAQPSHLQTKDSFAYDSNRPLRVESHFQDMNQNNNFLSHLQKFQSEDPPEIHRLDRPNNFIQTDYDFRENQGKLQGHQEYHHTEPQLFHQNRDFNHSYKTRQQFSRKQDDFSDNLLNQKAAEIEEHLYGGNHPKKETYYQENQQEILKNDSEVIDVKPAQNEFEFNAKIKMAELELEMEKQNKDQEAYMSKGLNEKMKHPNWKIRKDALYQIKLIVENWAGVSEDKLISWFEKSTSDFDSEMHTILTQKKQNQNTYSQNWGNSSMMVYFKDKFEKRILTIVKEKNIALLDEGLQTILSYIYMSKGIMRYYGLKPPSKEEVLRESPIGRDVFNKMLVLLMNTTPNKKYEIHLNRIFTFALERDSQLITSHILSKCREKNISVQLNSLKILSILLNTKEYFFNKELLLEIMQTLLHKKVKWAVKCRELICKNLNICLQYFQGNRHEFLKQFFGFIYKERKVVDQFKWVDIGVKEKEKFDQENLFRLKKRTFTAPKEDQKTTPAISVKSEKEELSSTKFDDRQTDNLNIPDPFINLMYENNIQKKREIIENFLEILERFRQNNRRINFNETTSKSIEGSFRVTNELLEESNLMFYLPGLKIGQIYFELLPPKSIHKIMIKQFINQAVGKFNLKQNINVIIKDCFELIVTRKFLDIEVLLKIALNFVYKSKFLNVKEFGLNWLANQFVRKHSFRNFKQSFLEKLEDMFCSEQKYGSKSRRGMSTSKPRFSSVKKTFSTRNAKSRKKSHKNLNRNTSLELDVVVIVLRILEHFKNNESNMKTQKLISKYVTMYIENQARRAKFRFQAPPDTNIKHKLKISRENFSKQKKLSRSNSKKKIDMRMNAANIREFHQKPKEELSELDRFLAEIEDIQDVPSFVEFVHKFKGKSLDAISKKVKFKIVSQKMEFIFREIAPELNRPSHLLDFVTIFIGILSSTEKEKLFVLTITFIGLSPNCDFLIFDALFDAVKRPFKCFNFSHSIIRENFEQEEYDLFNANVTRYFKNKLEESLTKQTVFFKNNLSFIIESVLQNCLESEFQEEFVSFLEKCCQVYSEELLIDIISNFVKNNDTLVSFGIELVKSFQNKFDQTMVSEIKREDQDELEDTNNLREMDIIDYKQNPQDSEFNTNLKNSGMGSSHISSEYTTQFETNLESDKYTTNNTQYKEDNYASKATEALDSQRDVKSTFKSNIQTSGKLEDNYPSVLRRMEHEIEKNREAQGQTPFISEAFEHPIPENKSKVGVDDLHQIDLNKPKTSHYLHRSKHSSPDLKNIDQSPNYKLQRLQRLQNKREQRIQSRKKDESGSREKGEFVKKTKDYIIRRSSVSKFGLGEAKNLNEVETEKQYNKYKQDKSGSQENLLNEFQPVNKIKMFSKDKEVQTEKIMEEDEDYIDLKVKVDVLLKEIEARDTQIHKIESENRGLKAEIIEFQEKQEQMEANVQSLEMKIKEKPSMNIKEEDQSQIIQFNNLSPKTIHLLLFAPLRNIKQSNDLFSTYTQSDPQSRKDFLFSLKELLINKRLVHSISRSNLMYVINFCLKVSISQTSSITSTEIEKKLSGLLVDKILNSKPHIEMISIFLELIKHSIPEFDSPIDQSVYLLLKFYLNCSQRFIEISEKVDCFNFLRVMGELFDERPPEKLNDQVVSLEIFDEIFRSLRAMSDEVIRKNAHTAKIFFEVYREKFKNQVFINYVSNYLVSLES